MSEHDVARPPGSKAAGDGRRGAIRDARALFDELWAEGDPWDLDGSSLDQTRYRRQVELIGDRRYGRALEIGCAGGSFTRHLAPMCDSLLAIDIAPAAIERARGARLGDGITFAVADVMEMDLTAGGPWDLIVLAETAYYLGWSHSLYDVGWLAHSLCAATAPGGRLLLANTIDQKETSLMSPWLIPTYRDLLLHAGYGLEAEETVSGVKNTVAFDILLSLLVKPPT